jgi:hypothetical protein
MDENLVGYLLQSLDPETQAQVEDYLHSHPEAQARLERLRQALEPLAANNEEVAAPPGLWVRTLAHIAAGSPPRRGLPGRNGSARGRRGCAAPTQSLPLRCFWPSPASS